MHEANNNCECCNGTGSLTYHRLTPETCGRCGGTGKQPPKEPEAPRFPHILNATETCDCGASKNKRKQFCESCWKEVPEPLHHKFTHTVLQLQSIITACRLHLPPCLPPTGTES